MIQREFTTVIHSIDTNKPSPGAGYSNLPVQVQRVCPCGCDQRDRKEKNLLGYFIGIKHGIGFNVEITDPEVWAILEPFADEKPDVGYRPNSTD